MTKGTKAAVKTAESVLAFCVVGLACFIGGQSFAMRKLTARHESAGAIVERVHAVPTVTDTGATESTGARANRDESFGTAAPEMRVADVATSSMPATSALDLRRRLRDGARGTYIDDLITSRDSSVVRWPDRLTRPLRVWVSEDDRLAGWNADFVTAVRDAFDTWVETGIPVHFTFIRDSASADVHVQFTERFASGISGKTIWSRDAAWWLVSSDIQLGLAHPSGGTVTPPQMRAIALHEVGHLLGLDHARELDNIMSARIRVRDLTETDRATVRLLYSVPAGSLR
jgi:predicted Zn-dependent protease